MLFFLVLFLLFYLIIFLLSNRINAKNTSTIYTQKIENLYPLHTNDQLNIIAAQFDQNPNWEHGNMRILLTQEEETSPTKPVVFEPKTGPGIIKNGIEFHTDDMHPYRIDPNGVHPHTEHHIFLVRHGKLK